MKERKKDAKEKKEGNDFFLFHESKHEAEDRIIRSPAWTGDLIKNKSLIMVFLAHCISARPSPSL